MIEEYDRTVKELRSQIEQLQTALMNQSRMTPDVNLISQSDVKKEELSFLNLSGDQSMAIESQVADTQLASSETANHSLTVGYKVVTLKDDLALEMKRRVYDELSSLREENSAMKDKLMKLAAEKKKMEQRSLNESQVAVPLGDRTMASCVRNTAEYLNLQKTVEQRDAILKFVKHRLKSMQEIIKCFGYEIEFKNTESEVVVLVPLFRPPPSDSTIGESEDYFLELEHIENKWQICRSKIFSTKASLIC